MRTLSAEQVIVAAGTYGTQRLLHRMKDDGRLPRLSSRLGRLSRTNSESILGAVAEHARRPTSPEGVAITSSFYPEPHTHVEPCRYGKGSNAMGLLQSVLTTPRPGQKRWQASPRELVRNRGTRGAAARRPALERALDHLAGHADGRQLAHRHGQAPAGRAAGT